MYTDLARVNSEAENTELYNLLPRNAWIGLYRRPWSAWSDHTPTNFTNWEASQLGGFDPTLFSCGAINTTTGLWFNVNCEEKHNFFCERLIPPRSRVKLRFRSGADLTDPQIQLQILEQVPDSQLLQESRCRCHMCLERSIRGLAMSQTCMVL
ncbi:hypothetical protein OJAV_G00106110 [Oryzias javanicus]|uniref:C-type lectin domain-containing protein n=1 Tax=Oryzias javanicus TaxID=123683 RepID=A0A437CTR3_ORYJA|nr:hypothetical protein OJAV_G00106110 [Oryzias javanicus]